MDIYGFGKIKMLKVDIYGLIFLLFDMEMFIFTLNM